MHQMGRIEHLTGGKRDFLRATRKAMAPVNGNTTWRSPWAMRMALAMAVALAIPALQAQSGSSQTQTQSQPPANSQPAQDIPDAPSTVQPPPPPAKPIPAALPPGTSKKN